MAFCESQWFGGGGATSTASTASDAIWYGNGTTSTTSSYTGINCWMTGGSGGGGMCTTTEYVNFQEMQALQMEHQQSLMQMQMQAQQIYAAQGLHQCGTNQMSAEERRHQQAQAEALQQTRREQLKKIEEAQGRAKDLLLEHLTPVQKETFNKNKWFVVEGGKSKQQYRIRAESHLINIEVMDGKKAKYKLCAHLSSKDGAIPHHDHILAQKIMLESAEDDFLKIANRHAA